MNKADVKQLAKLTVKDKTVRKDTAAYVLNKLSRKDLIFYLRYLKSIVGKNTVRILSGQPIPEALKRELATKFRGKYLIFEQNKEVGDGIQAIAGDTTIDLSIRGYLDETVSSLKNKIW